MLATFAKQSETAIPIHVVESDGLKTISMVIIKILPKLA